MNTSGSLRTRQHRDCFTIEKIGKWDAAPNGGIQAPAILTRCGVFQYEYGNELRHPDDVFEPESLESLRGAPVVIGHPGDITAENWRVLTVGTIADDVRAERSGVAATIRVADAAAAEAVRAKALVELSCGYSCFVTEESGSYDGIAYQTRQRGIRYNHVGMGPEGWGRAGPTVRIYTDSNGKERQIPEADQGAPYIPNMQNANLTPVLAALATLVGAGVIPAGKADAAPQPAPVPPQPQPAPVPPQGITQAQYDALRGEADAQKAELERLRKAEDERKADAASKVTAAIAETAAKFGVQTHAKMNDREMRCAVIDKLTPGVKVDGESDEYVRAVYDSAIRSASGTQTAGRALEQATGVHTDGTTNGQGPKVIGSKIEEIRMKQIADSQNMWKQPGPGGTGVRKAG